MVDEGIECGGGVDKTWGDALISSFHHDTLPLPLTLSHTPSHHSTTHTHTHPLSPTFITKKEARETPCKRMSVALLLLLLLDSDGKEQEEEAPGTRIVVVRDASMARR